MAINPVGSSYFPTKITGINKIGTTSGTAKASGKVSPEDCNTCQERKYRCGDGNPEKVNANTSTAQVMTHEKQHLTEQRSDAERKGMEVVNTSIKIDYDRCPECGTMYASGGEAKTTMIKKADQTAEGIGSSIDLQA